MFFLVDYPGAMTDRHKKKKKNHFEKSINVNPQVRTEVLPALVGSSGLLMGQGSPLVFNVVVRPVILHIPT